MNEKLKSYSEAFKYRWEEFLNGCDSIEEAGLWNKAEYGEMDVFYSSDVTSIIIRLVAADGNITQKEADYLRELFGISYTVAELTKIYENKKDAIDGIFEEGAKNGLNFMRKINSKLAEEYYSIIITVCDIVIESDGIIAAAEVELAKEIKSWKA